MEVLQVYQAKLLHDMDESGHDPVMFKEQLSMTDLVLQVIAGYASVPAKKSQLLHCIQLLKKTAL